MRTVDITSYLPEGTALVLASDAKVDVTVKVEAVVKESFEVPTANLAVNNLREGYRLEFEEDVVPVEISGPSSIISNLEAKDIKGTVNANGTGTGKHQMTVDLTLEKYCWLTETIKVPVQITGNEGATAEETPQNQQNGQGGEAGRDVVSPTETTNDSAAGTTVM